MVGAVVVDDDGVIVGPRARTNSPAGRTPKSIALADAGERGARRDALLHARAVLATPGAPVRARRAVVDAGIRGR